MRTRAIEAVKILNDFISDAVVGTRSIEIFDKLIKGRAISEGTKIGMARMCYFHLILLLAKWAEFYEKYRSIIPADCVKECRALNNEVRKLDAPMFRNKYVGHIWNKDTKRPLTSREISRYMDKITKGDRAAFLHWINNSKNNRYPNSVVSVISHVRDRLRTEYKIKNEPFEET